MPERRHRNLVLGTMALLVAVIAAADVFVLGGTTDLDRVDAVVWGFVATVALVPYASSRARRVRASVFRSRPARVVVGLFGLALLALTGWLLLEISTAWGRESPAYFLGTGFWIFVFGLSGAGALWAVFDERLGWS